VEAPVRRADVPSPAVIGPTGWAGTEAMDTRTAATGRRNRVLAALSSSDRSLLERSLETLPMKQGVVLQEAGQAIDHVYFPHEGMISLLAVMTDGQAMETATVGSEGAVGAMSGFGTRFGFTRAVVQAPGTASRIPAREFRKIVQESASLRNLLVGYNEVLLAQI
jgi:CRP-like cAMP-binding protein